ncbi:MAG: ABC transporter substrate-binding protein, partial [Acidimicrobiia bacterium]
MTMQQLMIRRARQTTRRSLDLVALAAAMTLALAACSSGSDSGSATTAGSGSTSATAAGSATSASVSGPTVTAPPAEPSLCPADALAKAKQPVEITMWHSMSGSNATVLGDLVNTYNGSQSAVKVSLVYQGTYDESLSKYIAALRGGDLPDLMQTEETAMQLMVDSKSTVPAQACVDASKYDTSDYLGEVLDQYRIGGVLVTMPFQLSNPVLYYNRALFTKAGLDPDKPPATFDELIAVSQKLVDAKVVKKGAMSLDAYPWIVEQWMAMAGSPVVDNDNGRAARATKTLFDSDAGKKAFGVLAEMAGKGLVFPATSDELAKYLAVATGDSAMTLGSSSSLGTIYDEIGRFPGVEIGVAKLPGPTGGGITVGGGSLWMAKNSDDGHKAASWDFQTWLNEPAQQITWALGTGYIPTRASVSTDPALSKLWAERPGFKVAFDQLAQAPRAPGGGSPVIGDYAGVRTAIEAA